MTNPGTGLVERLRKSGPGYRHHMDLIAEAADHIASLLSGGGEPVAWRYHEAGVSLWNYATARPPIGADGMPAELWTAEPLYSESALAAVRKERDEARRIIAACAAALPNGAAVSAQHASLEFMAKVPEEIAMVCARLAREGEDSTAAATALSSDVFEMAATIADLREALRPFAAIGEELTDENGWTDRERFSLAVDDQIGPAFAELTSGDFRAARRARAKTGEAE